MKKTLYMLLAAALLFAGCQKEEKPQSPPWDELPRPESANAPLDPGNNVVAHRGGSAECGSPDNSIASLKYAMSLGCYGSECDIYWTKDNNIVVAHADGDTRINGLHPWEATLDELRAAGKLDNGEDLPSLDEYLDVVMSAGSCTKLVLDIKKTPYKDASGNEKQDNEVPIAATRRACEIIKEKKAENFVEFICCGIEAVMRESQKYALELGVDIGWNTGHNAAAVYSRGFSWANLSTVSFVKFGGTCTFEEFEEHHVLLSVYCVDKEKFDSNSIYKDADVEYMMGYYPMMRTICSNYPAWIMDKIKLL